MDIRIRIHNDNPDLAVVEWIVDDKVKSDVVCSFYTDGIIEGVSRLIKENSSRLDISYEDAK